MDSVTASVEVVLLGTQHPIPTSVGYTLLLLAHIASTVVGFGAVLVTGIQAGRARRGPEQESPDSVRRYFRPGTNWAGRTLYLVPAFGAGLIATSGGAFGASSAFIESGLVLWAVAVLAAEMVLWPAERRIQEHVTSGWELGDAFRHDCTMVVRTAWFLMAIFLVAVVLMVAKP
jgi:hypothetical protein